MDHELSHVWAGGVSVYLSAVNRTLCQHNLPCKNPNDFTILSQILSKATKFSKIS